MQEVSGTKLSFYTEVFFNPLSAGATDRQTNRQMHTHRQTYIHKDFSIKTMFGPTNFLSLQFIVYY